LIPALDGHFFVTQLREYDVVRVIKLIHADRPFDSSEGVRRPPRVGDVATICHEYEPDAATAAVAVEMVDGNGLTLWLADFQRDELELVRRG
jgi:hypothetical protein